ncbi:putative quinol monooxygenase [Nocardioides sp. CFH 31398]|uniref:putative quinol monooxygenase n=1 Tax=Nocardioides sp. CFH 31398 TaxID=2919579 RepID=UPI001F06554D|nr:antibiotic biosynthesis monooxygenase [Nocardioides sp. CFH 31398]MCH1867981.1 antibiotic biosynthesis monooxygenase [Nocardioides sp. CFH 31398]
MSSTEILGIARIAFADGGAEEFKRLSERCMEIVRTQDTGTLQYDIYLDDDETRAVVVERYRDSAALVEHLANIGDELMAAVMACGEMEGETLGVPGPELRAMMGENAVGLLLPHASL